MVVAFRLLHSRSRATDSTREPVEAESPSPSQTPARVRRRLTLKYRAQQTLMKQHAEHTRIMLQVSGVGGDDSQANPSASSSQQ